MYLCYTCFFLPSYDCKRLFTIVRAYIPARLSCNQPMVLFFTSPSSSSLYSLLFSKVSIISCAVLPLSIPFRMNLYNLFRLEKVFLFLLSLHLLPYLASRCLIDGFPLIPVSYSSHIVFTSVGAFNIL
ncbi:hypothetical protein P301_M12336 [Saccharomyces cerevisiae P301]|uniref:Putative uncharacterized membrane protein YMR172C-A n=2 Tax=Saccharomyces cerevisiae TaxID=4932 RepID=YM172_YEAST|nr:RecName: Full=Putative uncharacterized membrane protein YMR172C-A [Saccharomyces cerevisiae S288C]AHX39334.1 hypothetical protein YMR172C-A [Saccharomyces cerevisiae]EWG89448.1 hypothetical protein P301_M12336 [Saccharomyces cerevisiae P301]KZV09020.1 hypothetical protein WN66_05015 [Saccharomyces cerevisiae]CAY81999.1 EC1118_1M3_3598p [Saccharomyces cerevisiae EC1118]